MYYEKKVFVTGVYGVGKTYYAQNVVPKICSREYIDFDKNFSYKTQSLDEIHRKMNEYDKLFDWLGSGESERSDLNTGA